MHRWLLTLLLGAILAVPLAVGAASAAVVQPVYVRTIGSGPGADLGRLRWPRGMAISEAAGLLYVAESGNNRVQTFSTATGLAQGYLGAASPMVTRSANGRPAKTASTS